MSTLERRLHLALACAFVVWAAAFIWRTSFLALDGQRYFCVFDDAMISMRYAWNFSHGYGLVWNPAERVQGYTNLLMTLLMSLSTWQLPKAAAVLAVQIFGVGTMLVTAVLTRKIADELLGQQARAEAAVIRVIAFAGALCYYPMVYWSLMGMETGLVTALLYAALLNALRWDGNGQSRTLWPLGMLLGLAFLTRNDSLLVGLPIWGYVAIKHQANRGQVRAGISGILGALLIYGLFIVGQLAFQQVYYGSMLPNTYYLKLTGMPIGDRLANGLGFFWPFAVSIAAITALAAAGSRTISRLKYLLLTSIALIAFSYQIYIGGDPWSYWRLVSPAVPLLLTSAAFGAIAIFRPRGGDMRSACRRAVLLCAIALALADAAFMREILFISRPFGVSRNELEVNTAIALAQLTSADATVGVFFAGAIPYYLDRRAIDFLGKSDPYVARLEPDLSGSVAWAGMYSVPGHNKYDLHYSIQQLRPTYVQGFRWGTQDVGTWAEDYYAIVDYRGVRLFLLRSSVAVDWSVAGEP